MDPVPALDGPLSPLHHFTDAHVIEFGGGPVEDEGDIRPGVF